MSWSPSGGQKGNIQDLLVIPAVLIAIAIIGPTLWGTAQQYMTQMGVNFNILGFTTAANIANTTAGLYVTWDQVFLIMAVGLVLSVIISSFFIDSHPIFFFISVIIYFIAMTIAPILSDFYNSFIGGFTGFDAAKNLPITTAIIQNYPLYILGTWGAMGVALYAKFVRGRE